MGYGNPHPHSGVQAIISLLDIWFDRIQDGTHVNYYPSMDYEKTWTDAQVDAVIIGIDEEVDKEVHRGPGTRVNAKEGPDFKRLAPLQRLALVQDLHRTIEENAKTLDEIDHPVAAARDALNVWYAEQAAADLEALYTYDPYFDE